MRKLDFTPPSPRYNSFANDYHGLVENHSSSSKAESSVLHQMKWLKEIDNTPSDAESSAERISIGSSEDGYQADYDDRYPEFRVGSDRWFTDRTASKNGDVTVRHYQADGFDVYGWEVTRDHSGQYHGFDLVAYEQVAGTLLDTYAYKKMTGVKAQMMFARGDAVLRDLGKG